MMDHKHSVRRGHWPMRVLIGKPLAHGTGCTIRSRYSYVSLPSQYANIIPRSSASHADAGSAVHEKIACNTVMVMMEM